MTNSSKTGASSRRTSGCEIADRALTSFVSDLDRAGPPRLVTNHASLVVADTIGAVLGDASNPAVAALARRWAGENGDESAVMEAADERTTTYRATFVDMAVGNVLELDEGYRFAAGHPAIRVLPALLTDGESAYRSGDELLTAFIAGYEAAARAAETVAPLADGLHPHGVWGGIGIAAAVARLRGLDAETTLGAMRVATNCAQHTRFEATTEGTTVRSSYAGMSNLSELLAVDQAESGFTGLDDGVARHLGPVATDGPDQSAFADSLGERWEIKRDYFKVRAAYRCTHTALDAVALLIEETSVGTTDIDAVTVETYPAAAALSEPASQNALQAKFSVPFAVASALTTGETDKKAFTDETLTKTALGFTRRVDVVATKEFAARTPDERGARVIVETADDGRYAREVRAARGGEHDPVTESELRAKFDRLVAPIIDDDDVDGL